MISGFNYNKGALNTPFLFKMPTTLNKHINTMNEDIKKEFIKLKSELKIEFNSDLKKNDLKIEKPKQKTKK